MHPQTGRRVHQRELGWGGGWGGDDEGGGVGVGGVGGGGGERRASDERRHQSGCGTSTAKTCPEKVNKVDGHTAAGHYNTTLYT